MLDTNTLLPQLQLLANTITPFDKNVMTLGIKKLFASQYIGKYDVFCNRMGEEVWDYVTDEVEYLFDLIVVEQTKSKYERSPFITKTILSLESELDSKKKLIIDDFQKLLISNSELKIFVFKCHSDDFAEYFDFMRTNHSLYSNANGKFDLVVYRNEFTRDNFFIETL